MKRDRIWIDQRTRGGRRDLFKVVTGRSNQGVGNPSITAPVLPPISRTDNYDDSGGGGGADMREWDRADSRLPVNPGLFQTHCMATYVLMIAFGVSYRVLGRAALKREEEKGKKAIQARPFFVIWGNW